MDIADGLIQYLMLIALLTFHEFGHAWTAWKCGDDTAKRQGRVSLNPVVHIDPIGTIVLPLLMIFLPIFGGSGGVKVAGFMIGWAKPVPVNLTNLKNRNWDDVLITLAGPGMNLLLAVVLVGLARVMQSFDCDLGFELCLRAASLSLLLCFFNMIPIPPLDGSHIMRKITGMTYETHLRISRYGIFLIIIFLQIPGVRTVLGTVCERTLFFLCRVFHVELF